MLAGGKLADKFGRRNMFQLGMLIFGVSSLAAGLAPNAAVLIGMRAVQGAGGALVLPALLSILASDATEKERHLGAGIATAGAAIALALGPLVGGAITEYWHWSWIFFINVPVVIGTLMLSFRLPKVEPVDRNGRLDIPGLVLSGIALSLLTWALIEGARRGWGSPSILGALVLAAVAGALFVLVESRSPSPMMRVELFRNRPFCGATASQFLWGLAINGVFFFTSLFLQDILHFSPTAAGATFIPLAVTLVVLVPFIDKVVNLFDVGPTIAAGLVLVAAGLLWASTVGESDGFPELLPALILIGAGSALSIPMTSSALSVVPVPMAGMASSVLTSAKEIAGVFGIVLTGAVLALREAKLRSHGASDAAAFVGGYHLGLQVGALLSLVGAVVAWRTLRRPRRDARHRALIEYGPELPGRHRRPFDLNGTEVKPVSDTGRAVETVENEAAAMESFSLVASGTAELLREDRPSDEDGTSVR